MVPGTMGGDFTLKMMKMGGLTNIEEIPGVFVADIFYEWVGEILGIWNFTGFDIGTDEITENTAEVFMTGE